MSKHLLLALCVTAAFGWSAAAQSTDSNPAHAPSVFLGNHRPPNKKNKAPTSRSVKGKVVDASGQPLSGALVTITDTKANEKLTFITKADGQYHFDDLSFNVDYQLQAHYKDALSESRKLSQYDHTPNMVRILDIGGNRATATEAKKQETQPKQ